MFKDELQTVRKTMFRMIFALAMALKVSPKKLAKFYDEKKMDKFAEDFHKELLEADKKEQERVKKALTITPRKK